MNWNSIEESSPKSREILDKWIQAKHGTIFSIKEIDEHGLLIYEGEYRSDDKYFNDRDLYDFFDENGIRVTIDLFQDDFDIEIYINQKEGEWEWLLIYESDTPKEGWKGFKTRTEAETAAFTKAFGILEEKLK